VSHDSLVLFFQQFFLLPFSSPAPVSDRKNAFVLKSFPQTESNSNTSKQFLNKLIERCRHEKVTLNSVMIAALALSMYDVRKRLSQENKNNNNNSVTDNSNKDGAWFKVYIVCYLYC
jgi:hypothetical protein